MRRLRPLLVGLLVLALPGRPAAQAPDLKTAFLDALGAFSLALDGRRGDEAVRLRAALDRMDRALAEWDGVLAGYEQKMATEIQTVDARLEARMRTVLGATYLDRGRIRDALEQFTMARALDVSHVDAPLLQGLVYSQLLEEPAAAIDAFRAAAAIDPENPAVAYLLARQLQQEDRENEASASVTILLDLFSTEPASTPRALAFVRLGLLPEVPGLEPFLPPVRYAEGFAAVRRGDLLLAIEQFRKVLATDPLSAPVSMPLRERAAAAFSDGRLEEAREILADGIRQHSDEAELHRLRGLVEVADRRYAEGIRALRRAIELDPESERARLALTDALTRNGQSDAAVASLQETLAAIRASGRARYALAQLHREDGRYLETLAELERVVSHDPLLGRNSIHQTIGALHRAQLELPQAVDAYLVRAALTPDDAAAHQDLGEVYLLQGDTAWAHAEFRIALLLEPSRLGALTGLSQVHLREGRYEDAALASARALAIDAQQREARYVYGTALLRLGRVDEGRQQLQAYQRLLEEDARAQADGLELGRLRREAAVATAAGNHATAADLLTKALAYDDTSAAAHLDLGLALLNAGRFTEAADHLSFAVVRDAPLEVYLHLAQAYDGSGQTDRARRARELYESMKRAAIRQAGGGP
jgi:tetratricopeptide (TPR) repeat protein